MLTKEEMIKLQNEINSMYGERKVFAIIASLLLASFLPLLILAIITQNGVFTALASLSLFFGIVLFILRSALYNTRIRNRKRLIQETKNQLELDKLYSQRESDKKISL